MTCHLALCTQQLSLSSPLFFSQYTQLPHQPLHLLPAATVLYLLLRDEDGRSAQLDDDLPAPGGYPAAAPVPGEGGHRGLHTPHAPLQVVDITWDSSTIHVMFS